MDANKTQIETSEKQGTPLKCIRLYCLECMNQQTVEVRECPSVDCPTHAFRLNKKPVGASSLKAIRARCLDCRGGHESDVRRCEETACPLHHWRTGHNPGKKAAYAAKEKPASYGFCKGYQADSATAHVKTTKDTGCDVQSKKSAFLSEVC